MLFLSHCTFAQNPNVLPHGCNSTWSNYPSIKEERSIVRSNDRYMVVHTQYWESQNGMLKHTFHIKRFNEPAEIFISTYFNAQDNTEYKIDITDMEIFHDECFFCGTIYYNYTHNFFTNENERHGFVGHFNPASLMSGSGDIKYADVDFTTSLTRLCITRNSQYDNLISVIGEMDYDHKACLAEIGIALGGGTDAYLSYIDNNPDILFSDILSNEDSVTLLAQYRCSNDITYGNEGYQMAHQIFMLDRFSRYGCHNDILPGVIHYMAHYMIDANEDCNFHYKNAPMALSNLFESDFAVVYGVKENGSEWGGLRLFPFRHIWKYDSCIYHRTGKQVAVCDVGNLWWRGDLLMLSRDNNHPLGIVSFLSLPDDLGQVTKMTASGQLFNSVSKISNTTDAVISGHNGTFNYNLYEQAFPYSLRPSCYNIEYCNYSVFPEREGALLLTEWKSIPDLKIDWVKAETQKVEAAPDTVCIKCY